MFVASAASEEMKNVLVLQELRLNRTFKRELVTKVDRNFSKMKRNVRKFLTFDRIA